MLPLRTETILKSIVGRYIINAVPVPSQSIIHDYGLGVSSATIRNEMARLEQDGYIIRPHTSAGSVPSDMGYRYYVESLEDIDLPLNQQHQIEHMFHQVETRLEEWLSLTATLLSHLANNMAVVFIPRPSNCQFKHLEVVNLQDNTALLVMVLYGAKVRQQLVTFEQPISQSELTAISIKLNAVYTGLTTRQISDSEAVLSDTERQLTDCVLSIMQNEDEEGRDEPYIDGLHFTLDQPEFTGSRQMLPLVELVEQRNRLKTIVPRQLPSHGVQVVIGKENEAESIRDYSVVLSRYGLPDEAVGTIAIIGPTRMPYARSIAAIDYLAWLLSRLIARLYGKETQNQRDHSEN
ncbi:MAG: heat-inducible transcription repressor HrcA [Dehalococcoidales bacterium]|nr:MAG: heat-inducible transcription repressor HrcA [Dehalococcoidales bacterium]